VLKSPDHLYALDERFSVFPDAFIIQTHRNPLEVLKSSIELAEVLHSLFGRRADPEQLSKREARVLADKMERAMRFRAAHPELAERFIDVNYDQIIAEPTPVIRRIYEQSERALTQTVTDQMRRFISARSRYRRRRPRTLGRLRPGCQNRDASVPKLLFAI